MEMFDEIVSAKIEDGKVTVERKPTEDALQAEEMEHACGVFLVLEKKFQRINAQPEAATDLKLNAMWWDALESVYRAERVVWRLFVGSQPTPKQNALYAKFRKLLLEERKLKANA